MFHQHYPLRHIQNAGTRQILDHLGEALQVLLASKWYPIS